MILAFTMGLNTCEYVTHYDGTWGQWSGWSKCSTTCGVGTHARRRRCNPPTPNGGKQCVGSPTELKVCINEVKCPG